MGSGRTGGEEEAGDVARSGIECGGTDSESNDCESHHARDVPCPVVEFAR